MSERKNDPGELLMVGIPGPTLDSGTRRQLEALGTRGVILFRRNFRTPAQVRRLCSALHDLRPDMLIGIDHEGGRVNRPPPPFTTFPPAARVAATGSAPLAAAVGRAIGRELASIGVDLDFAPDLDVLTHARNRVIGDRAFGTTPAQVSRLGLAFARGLQAAGIIPCGKHFPGHGGTHGDSHMVLPRVARARADVMRAEVAPFRAAIAARLPCLMMAHIVYRNLDPRTPASLSSTIIEGILRRLLGFRGVIFSDDLEMGALSRRLSPEEIAVRAIAAGTDMLLWCSNLDKARRARAGLDAALESGRLPASRVHDALTRTRRLRRRGPRDATIRRWPCAAHRELVEKVERLASAGRASADSALAALASTPSRRRA